MKVNKKVYLIETVVLLTLFFLLFFSFNVHASNLNLDVKSYILMEKETGKVLLENKADTPFPPASVTKVMSLLLIYDAISDGKIKYDDIITVSKDAASMGGSQVYLEEGEKQTVRDLLKSVIIASGNDAVVALGEAISGTKEGFIEQMNQKAKELDMKNTHFINVTWLDAPGHEMSARDIGIVSRELIKNHPEVFEFTTIWQDTITHNTRRGSSEFGLTNTNRLIKQYPYTTGLKTGSTGNALYCISATAKKDDMELIAVIMGGKTSADRFDAAVSLLNYGYANYGVTIIKPKGEFVTNIKIGKAKNDLVDVETKTQISYLRNKGQTITPTEKVTIYEGLKAPMTKGTKVGEIEYYFNDDCIGRGDLIIRNDVYKASFSDNMQKQFSSIFNSK